MIRLLYNLLWPFGLLFFLPGYLVKMFRRGGYRANFEQRFAFYDRNLRRRLREQPPIWLHAVSVGEIIIALKLARAIRTSEPEAPLLLSTTTTTGFGFANKNALPGMDVIYTPLDFWPIMRRAFVAIRPQRIILIEAEVWPNLAAEAHTRSIPLVLVNARLSPRSERRMTQFCFFVSPTFRLLDLVCIQEARDAERWAALGVPSERIRHTGSIKYDPDDRTEAPGRPPYYHSAAVENLVLFGGSTHRGEEEILARIFLKLRPQFASLSLFIAPRHIERVSEIRKRLENLSHNVTLCSEKENASQAAPDCLLLDKTGELRRWYQMATVVFVGKSLTAHGGQNPVEPLMAGKPVIFGPNMENFAALARELVVNRAAVQVNDEKSLQEVVENLLRDPDERDRLVQNAGRVLDAHRGATMRTARLVLELQ
ncbi:MAG: hypothetical protein JWO45_910 [Spartobacteria bacterium]|nr:hypothetical protein [Spartobacteria bacterium]